ncbi:IS200/IS605 family transposase [bacterium]|nr:IS200/IS605 family transposase [bacterium]
MSLKSGSHTKYDLKYHFVWCPKYRKVVLSGNIGEYLSHLIYEIAERYEFEVVELAVLADHVHMFVSANPDDSPSGLIQTIKSITARELFKKYPSIKRQLWGGALWERGYFVMSSGTGTTDEMIRQYIKEQRPGTAANDQPNLFG